MVGKIVVEKNEVGIPGKQSVTHEARVLLVAARETAAVYAPMLNNIHAIKKHSYIFPCESITTLASIHLLKWESRAILKVRQQ